MIFQLLNQLVYVKNVDALSEGEIRTMDTLVYILLDLYLQSEITLKCAIAKIVGDKYITCLIYINEIVENFFGRLLV